MIEELSSEVQGGLNVSSHSHLTLLHGEPLRVLAGSGQVDLDAPLYNLHPVGAAK